MRVGNGNGSQPELCSVSTPHQDGLLSTAPEGLRQGALGLVTAVLACCACSCHLAPSVCDGCVLSYRNPDPFTQHVLVLSFWLASTSAWTSGQESHLLGRVKVEVHVCEITRRSASPSTRSNLQKAAF